MATFIPTHRIILNPTRKGHALIFKIAISTDHDGRRMVEWSDGSPPWIHEVADDYFWDMQVWLQKEWDKSPKLPAGRLTLEQLAPDE
jgi:hypothetical protein